MWILKRRRFANKDEKSVKERKVTILGMKWKSSQNRIIKEIATPQSVDMCCLTCLALESREI